MYQKYKFVQESVKTIIQCEKKAKDFIDKLETNDTDVWEIFSLCVKIPYMTSKGLLKLLERP